MQIEISENELVLIRRGLQDLLVATVTRRKRNERSDDRFIQTTGVSVAKADERKIVAAMDALRETHAAV
jgi:hypothetical protein